MPVIPISSMDIVRFVTERDGSADAIKREGMEHRPDPSLEYARRAAAGVAEGVKEWPADVAAALGPDELDVAHNVAQRVAGKRGENIKSLGAGERFRKDFNAKLGNLFPSIYKSAPGTTELKPEQNPTEARFEEASRLVNPLFAGPGVGAKAGRAAMKSTNAVGRTARNAINVIDSRMDVTPEALNRAFRRVAADYLPEAGVREIGAGVVNKGIKRGWVDKPAIGDEVSVTVPPGGSKDVHHTHTTNESGARYPLSDTDINFAAETGANVRAHHVKGGQFTLENEGLTGLGPQHIAPAEGARKSVSYTLDQTDRLRSTGKWDTNVKDYGNITYEELPDASAPKGSLGIVKQKGGNWLNGSVEDALGGLKSGPEFSWKREEWPDNRTRFIKQDPAGKVLDVHEVNAPSADSYLNTHAPLNSWIDGPLTKYVKTRMASPEDEVRKLAEQGVLHFEPGEQPGAAWIKDRKVLAQRPLAVDWEGASDQAVVGAPVSHWRPGVFSDPFAADELSLIAGKNPDTPIYQLRDQERLGFDHLIDELSNALNPESGLPRHLQLSPEAMQNLSMEKAVRRVADINAWRAAQKAEANRALAEQASIVREYPHSDEMPNPKGLRWVELRNDPEGVAVPEGEGQLAIGTPGQPGSSVLVRTPEGIATYRERMAEKQLADQLKYEGDTMGHCVGGHCDGVLSGRSRIFSLRDAKGEPHVTVEVSPSRKLTESDLPDDVRDMLAETYGDASRDEFEAAVAKAVQERQTGDRITQIKGKQNRAPNAAYLPFVQDFVKNSPLGQPWSDVGDLSNAGLINKSSVLETHPAKLGLSYDKDYGYPQFWDKLPEYFSKDDWEKLMAEKPTAAKKIE